jgi:hypothetical protein
MTELAVGPLDQDSARAALDELFTLAGKYNSSDAYLELMRFVGLFRFADDNVVGVRPLVSADRRPRCPDHGSRIYDGRDRLMKEPPTDAAYSDFG